MSKCLKCGSRDIDFQESGGVSICVNCGTVLEENTIVSSIEFQVSCSSITFLFNSWLGSRGS
jgi:transcription factor IIIB subunit 2